MCESGALSGGAKILTGSGWRYRERGVNGERGLLRAKDKMKDRG